MLSRYRPWPLVLASASGLLNKVKQAQPGSSSSNLGSGLPNSDIASGLKEALSKGTTSLGVTQKYKEFSGGSPIDLDNYVTGKTLDGLFTMIGEEEQSIRHNPAAHQRSAEESVRRDCGGSLPFPSFRPMPERWECMHGLVFTLRKPQSVGGRYLIVRFA